MEICFFLFLCFSILLFDCVFRSDGFWSDMRWWNRNEIGLYLKLLFLATKRKGQSLDGEDIWSLCWDQNVEKEKCGFNVNVTEIDGKWRLDKEEVENGRSRQFDLSFDGFS